MADLKIDGQTYTDVDILNLEDTDGNEVNYYNDENLRLDYSKQITGKPKINGVELDGDKTLEALGIPTGGGSDWEKIVDCECTEEVSRFSTDKDINGNPLNIYNKETLIFILAAPSPTNTAKKSSGFLINGSAVCHKPNLIYDGTSWATRRCMHLGHLPWSFADIDYTICYGNNTQPLTALRSGWMPSGASQIGFKEYQNINSITSVGFYSGDGVFGVGSKVEVYVKG